MKNIIILLTFGLLAFNTSAQTTPFAYDSVFYYNPDGTQDWWYVQKDVFTFRCNGGSALGVSCNPATVDMVEYSPNSQRQQTTLKFSPSSSTFQRALEINNVVQTGTVEYATYTVTQEQPSNNNYSQDKFVKTNDLLIINFVSDNPTQQEINDFMSRNSLFMYHEPSVTLPSANWTYIFRISPEKWSNTFDATKSIFNSEQGFITRCIPDMQRVKPDACQPVSEFNSFSGTNAPDALWHIRNQGNDIATGQSGVNDADADICECWGEGFHGNGIKVAVIDFGGFDYTHPDMQGQFLTGYNVINNPVTSHTTSFWDNTNPQGHGMATCGVVVAKPNSTIQNTAVGVAYSSKIIPILTDGGGSQLIVGIQTAIDQDADIISMSLGYEDNNITQSFLNTSINNAHLVGRNGLGIVVIASTGNSDSDIKNWPAADTSSFGVGATDPNDYRGSYTQSIPWSWSNTTTVKGSNYFTPLVSEGDVERYNVVAPGTRIYTAWTSDPLGTPNQQNGAWTGTSFATPLTSGIAALILNKNHGLTAQEVEDAIQNNSEQIRTSTYNYNSYSFIPGYNKEVFFGRVNCLASLNGVALSLDEVNIETNHFNVAYLNQNEIGILFDNNTNLNGSIVSIYDMSGKLISTSEIEPNTNNHIVNTTFLSKGIYILNISDKNGTFNQSVKIAK
jgi:hypothetical protein